MALPVQSYVWSRLQNVIGNWALLVTGLTEQQLLWGDQSQPAGARPYMGLLRRTFTSHGFDTVQTSKVLVSATATVTASTAGETASLILGRRRIAYTLVGADDAETARDDLLAQVALTYEPAIATPNGTDKIDLVGKGGQALALRAVEGVTVVESRDFRKHAIGMRRAITRVSLFGFDTDGDDAGTEYADALIASLQTPADPGAQFLDANAVGVEAAASITAQNVSVNIPGSGIRENRIMFDVSFNAGARRYYPANGVVSIGDPIVEVTTLQATPPN